MHAATGTEIVGAVGAAWGKMPALPMSTLPTWIEIWRALRKETSMLSCRRTTARPPLFSASGERLLRARSLPSDSEPEGKLQCGP